MTMTSAPLAAHSFRQFAWLFGALFALAAVPVLLCNSLPLFDYPNHLARMHILADLSRSETLQHFYVIAWRPIPDLAMDAVVPLLAHATPLAAAGKAFVLLTLFLLAGGAAALNRVLFGAWSAWPCLAFLLLYSRTFLWGFLNYLFGLGLGLVALALWLALRRRPVALRLFVGATLGLALFFAHLLAFGLYGVMVLGYELGRIVIGRRRHRPEADDHRRHRRLPLAAFAGMTAKDGAALLVAALGFVPALAILFLATPASMGGAVHFAPLARKLDLLFGVFDNEWRSFDVACFVLALLALAVAFRRRWVRLSPEMAGPLGLLVLVYLAMPSQIATASGADHRIPVLLGIVLVAGSRWVGTVSVERVFLGAALLLFLLRLAVLTTSWEASDRIYAGLVPALDALPVGSRVAVAFPAAALNSEATPLAHFPTLAILRRDAFVPTLFAAPTQQPVALQPAYRALADRLPPERLWGAFVAADRPLDADERSALAAYDDVVFVGRSPFVLAPSEGLEPIFAAPRFALFAVSHKGHLDAGDSPR
jgi:hypothetical protein